MAYTIQDVGLGYPKIATTSTAPWPATPALGTTVKAVDPLYGVGEFIFLKGVVGTVVGSVVLYDPYLGTTSLVPAASGNGPVAVAMSANVANQYGWYQIAGAAAVKAPNAMTPGTGVYMLAATPGSVDDAVVAGEQIIGATVTTTTGTPAAGLGLVTLNRPSII